MPTSKRKRVSKYVWDLCFDPITTLGCSGYRLFDNSDRESADFIASLGTRYIWTQIDTGAGPILRPGRRMGSRQGYVVTLRPWPREIRDAVVG